MLCVFRTPFSHAHQQYRAVKPSATIEILGYLTERPRAGDSLDGIAEWWVLSRCVEHRLAEVREALSELVQRGFVTECVLKDTTRLYRLNEDKLPEIQNFLEQQP